MEEENKHAATDDKKDRHQATSNLLYKKPKSSLSKRDYLKLLKESQKNPVSFAVRTQISYDSSLDESVPVREKTISFGPLEFIHIKNKITEDWWIGRIVKEGSRAGFVPSPQHIEKIRFVQNLTVKTKFSKNKDGGKIEKKIVSSANSPFNTTKLTPSRNFKKLFIRKSGNMPPYEVVPAMRPVFLIGPSLRFYQVTELIQNSLMDFIERRFEGRIIRKRINVDLSLEKSRNHGKTEKLMLNTLVQVKKEFDGIFDAAKSLKLIIIDCNHINHPAQLIKTSLAPIQVHIKIESQQVLQKLIKTRGKSEKKHIGVQLVAAEKLNSCGEMFEVVLWENTLEEAGNHLCNYLEAYWRDTHPDEIID